MRKYLLFLIFVTLVLGWCGQKPSDDFDVNAVMDLAALQNMITKVSIDMNNGSLSPEDAQIRIDELQDRYLELTDIAQQDIEAQFGVIQTQLNKELSVPRSLPLRAKKMGMSEPQGMEFNTILSKQYANTGWYSSTTLVYDGTYDAAIQQAEAIAKRAWLFVSKTFEEGQAIAQEENTRYISGLDISSLQKGVVYVNHDLLDRDVENLLSVSVDQEGTLIIEATKYK